MLQPGESFLCAVQLANAKNHGAALALVPGGVVIHVVQQNRRRRAVEAAQTIASRLPIDARVLALTDHRLTIISWDVDPPERDRDTCTGVAHRRTRWPLRLVGPHFAVEYSMTSRCRPDGR